MSKTTIYTLGFFLALAAGIYAASLLSVPLAWIVAGGLFANGIGIVVASSYTSPVAPPAGTPKP